ncbi:MAG: IS1634 family transposase [Bacillota bacterium]|nr:IS1634 family transposase [Bacillota bacterium]
MVRKRHIYRGIDIVHPRAVPVIISLCRTARIAEIVNRMVKWNEANARVSPGLLIEALVVCIMCGRKPLWKVEQFWADQDMDLLFKDVDLTPDQLNDDALGRALEKLAEVDMKELLSAASLALLTAHKLSISTIHLDTTTKSVHGAYENDSHGQFKIEYAYGKDHRTDLKKFKIGAAIQEQGLPVFSELLAGKKPDTEWNREAVLEMKKFFEDKGYKDIVFVSDCVLVNTESLRRLARERIQFISRLPETFNLAGELKNLAFEKNEWRDLGPLSASNSKRAACYKTFATRHELDGRMYDFVVVQSSSLEERKEKTLARRIKAQKEELEKAARELATRDFACEPDARSAMDELMAKAAALGFQVQGETVKKETASYSHKGRPRKGEQPTITACYHASCVIGDIRDEFYDQLKKKESTFVLIANVKDRKKYDDLGILLEYKNQISIETRFRFLKSPVYLGPVFLEKPERVEALGYVFMLVLLVASYLEYRVRKGLKETGQVVLLPGNKKTDRPSTQTIMEILSQIEVLIIGGERYFPETLPLQAVSMVEWAGYDPDEIYLKPLECNF